MIELVCIVFWIFSVLLVWYASSEFVENSNWLQYIGLTIIVLIFAPSIVISAIGIGLFDKIFQEKGINKVAVIQFGAASGPGEAFYEQTASSQEDVDWYYFDKNEDREFVINDLKEHYDVVIEVIER